MTEDLIYCRTQTEFIDSVLDTVNQGDGDFLNELLNVTQMYQIVDLDFQDNREPNLDQPLSTDHNTLWKQLSQHHWFVCRSLHFNDVDRAFQHQSKKFSCLVAILNMYLTRMTASNRNDDHHDGEPSAESSGDDDPSWLLAVFNRHAHELRLLALLGKDDGDTDDDDAMDGSNADSTIQKCNSQFLQAHTSVKKFPATNKFRKVGIFIIVNQMLKTYYAIEKFNLCTYCITMGRCDERKRERGHDSSSIRLYSSRASLEPVHAGRESTA